ncbi:MAG: amidohydrolase [Sporomusaceae bacterium]|nr:amidohydrolase [Sporomusaceae bacterium]
MNTADFILLNGNIYTGNPQQPRAQALAARQGRIVAVGDNRSVRELAAAGAVIFDAGNQFVMSGFIDNHTHFRMGGETLLSVDLRDAKDRGDFSRRIAAHAATLPAGTWITGGSWDNEAWADSALPHRDWIDACTPQHPVLVYRLDLHMALANSLALKQAGIDRETPDPAGGTIERDAAGNPTGIVKDAAADMVVRAMPQLTEDTVSAQLTAAMRHANSLGVTSIQDVTSWQEYSVFAALRQRGLLTVRVAARTPISHWQKQADWIKTNGGGDEWLKLAGLKGFADGALGSRTAYFFEPYADEPGNCGLLHDQMHPEGIMLQRATAADAAGLQCSIHAIGDRANHELLELFTAVAAANGCRDSRHRIEHAQHLTPADLGRFCELGVIASVQPYHAIDDGRFAERRIGAERCRLTYPFRSLIEAGALVSFGTDWPVAPLNPLLGIYAAVTRATLDGRYPGGWMPQEKIDVAAALQAYTLNSAWAEFAEADKGSLQPGKLADIAVLSADLLAIEPAAIRDVQVVATIAGGQLVYQR